MKTKSSRQLRQFLFPGPTQRLQDGSQLSQSMVAVLPKWLKRESRSLDCDVPEWEDREISLFVQPVWTELNTALSLLEESGFTGGALHTVAAKTRLTAEVTACTHAVVLFVGVVSLGTLGHTRVVWGAAVTGVVFEWVSGICFTPVILQYELTQEEVRLVAAEAFAFAGPRAEMAVAVTLLALAIVVLVKVLRALVVPHAVSAGVFTPFGVAREAGGGLVAWAGQTGLVTVWREKKQNQDGLRIKQKCWFD